MELIRPACDSADRSYPFSNKEFDKFKENSKQPIEFFDTL